MAQWHSKNQTLLVGKESSFGTAVTTDKDLGLIQSFSPTDKRAQEKIYANGSRVTQEIVAGLVEIDWEINLYLQHARPIEYLFGDLTHAETTGDWKHSLTSIPTSVSSFTLEDGFNGSSDNVIEYAGNKLFSGTISLEKDGILTFNATGKAQTVDTSDTTASAAVISTLPVLHYKHTTISVGAASSESSVGKVQSFNLNYNNNTEPQSQAGSIEYAEFVEGNAEWTFDFSILFENLTEYQRFLGTTSSTAPVTSPTPYSVIFNSHNGVTLGSGRREFYAQLNNFQYEEVGTPVNVGEAVLQSFKGNAEDLGTNGIFMVDSISSSNFD